MFEQIFEFYNFVHFETIIVGAIYWNGSVQCFAEVWLQVPVCENSVCVGAVV